jgi:hypothetical protein
MAVAKTLPAGDTLDIDGTEGVVLGRPPLAPTTLEPEAGAAAAVEKGTGPARIQGERGQSQDGDGK